jgi:3-oxoacyl-[acyl-carrier protein] reductase
MSRFAGRVVLVTGAGRGMGRVVAEEFAREGATVVIAARTASYGEQTVADLNAAGHQASLVLADLADRDAVAGMFDAAVAAHGGLDVVVHCASDNAQGHITDMDDDALDHLLRSNVHALHWIAKAAVPHLAKSAHPGRLIFISSAGANRVYTPGLIAYMSTKAYMDAFARGLAVEVGPKGVLVNVVSPGMIATDRMLGHLQPEQIEMVAGTYAVPRAGQPEEIAAGVLYLASTEASYVTGSCLVIDGGASMAPFPARVVQAH